MNTRQSRLTFVMIVLLIAGTAAGTIAAGEKIAVGQKVAVYGGSVIDGDSIIVNKGKQTIEIRLFGIDSPEFDQPGAKDSRRAIAALVEGQSLLVEVMDHDSYGRTVALVRAGSICVNEEQVKAGLAWVHPRYCRIGICDRWRRLEELARTSKKGLWQYQRPVEPWRWKARKNRNR
jgi:micrococcal nuclease